MNDTDLIPSQGKGVTSSVLFGSIEAALELAESGACFAEPKALNALSALAFEVRRLRRAETYAAERIS